VIRKVHPHEAMSGRSGEESDDVDHIKQRLLHAGSDFSFDLLRRYPKATLAIAFAVGALAGRWPTARRTLWLAGAWGTRRLMHQWFAERRGRRPMR